jgi:hypothetical protein
MGCTASGSQLLLSDGTILNGTTLATLAKLRGYGIVFPSPTGTMVGSCFASDSTILAHNSTGQVCTMTELMFSFLKAFDH